MKTIHRVNRGVLAAAGLLLCLFSPTYLQAQGIQDENASRILAKVREAYSSLRSLSADYVSETDTHTIDGLQVSFVRTGSIKESRPNLCRFTEQKISTTGRRWEYSLIADGKTAWNIYLAKFTDKRTVTKGKVAPDGENIAPVLPVGLQTFFMPELLSPQPQQSTSGGALERHFRCTSTETIDGEGFDLIQQEDRDPDTHKGIITTYFIGKDNLIHRVQQMAFEEKDTGRETLWTSNLKVLNIKINQTFSADTFHYDSAKEKAAEATVLPVQNLLEVGTTAPEFHLKTQSGNLVDSKEILRKNSATIINFWFRGCGFCMLEMPGFEQIYKAATEKKIGLIMINVQDNAETIQRFLSRTGYTFPVTMDTSHEVFRKFNSTLGCPTTYILDKSGIVLWRSDIYKDSEISEIKQFLLQLPAKPK